MAAQIGMGAGVGAGVGALTVVCPPAGLAVGLGLAANACWNAGVLAVRASNATTQAEKKHIAKQATVACAKQM